ncbi:MAG: GNAT family N-acetyltransferase [Rhizobiales bacterium]|nr:GNAT family N-acetyltransferase [Hyphomicrobiales bacterium]
MVVTGSGSLRGADADDRDGKDQEDHAEGRFRRRAASGARRGGTDLMADASAKPVGLAAENAPASRITVVRGYRPGLIARITFMHAVYYARTSGFGQRFESVVASGLAEFCGRLDNPRNEIWAAVLDDEIVGSIAVDGEDLGGNVAHLRWFIMDDRVRGSGTGRLLLSTALAFADEHGFVETHLWTFKGLTAARYLYEKHGFSCVEERAGD